MENLVLNINKNNIVGKIKPMHAVNNAPYIEGKLYASMKDAGIPYSRLHDAGSIYPYEHLVDIEAIFPNFDADENNPDNYDFVFTDIYLKSLTDANVKPFYRLGATIENYAMYKAYRIFPPKDNLKWAKICEHIIMHYNEGWANGFHYNIEYWEIWNEPDNFPEIVDNQMWKGTKEEYYKLYQVSATYLKKKFPKLKIGGYASCGFYAIAQKEADPNAKVSPRVDYFIEFFIGFLKYITNKEHLAPLDFFSWHSYADVKSNIIFTNYCRKVLDEYGLSNTEHFLNEWNPGTINKGKLIDASNIVSNMLALQNTSLNMMMYYDIRLNTSYCGIYNPLKCSLPHVDSEKEYYFKAYYVFKAWNELYKLKNQVELTGLVDNVYAVASYDGKNGCVVITNNGDKEVSISLNGIDVCESLLISDDKDMEKIDINKTYSLLSYEVLIVKF